MPKSQFAIQFLRNALEHPDKVAVIDGNASTSYGECALAALSFSKYLTVDLKCDSSTVLGIQASHSVDFIVAMLACYLAHIPVAYLENGLNEAGILAICDRLGIHAVICDADLGHVQTITCKGICSTYLPEDAALSREGLESILVDDGAGALAEILFTTGTTGLSKGVCLTQDNVRSVLENVLVGAGVERDNVAYIPMPLNHVFALRRCQANLYRGATVVLRDNLRMVKRFFATIEECGVTSLTLAPSAIAYLLKVSGRKLGNYCEQIRYVESSSAPLGEREKSQLCELLPSTRLYNFYGCTESTACCVLEYSKYKNLKHCVGKPTVNATIRFVGEVGNYCDATAAQPARIVIGGSANMSGYWEDEAATKNTLIDGFVYTNDFGYLDERGFLYILGRIDDVILVGGNNVSPIEVEDLLMDAGIASECCLIGVPDKLSGNRLVLFLATEEGERDANKHVMNVLRGRVEDYKLPHATYCLEALPRTYNGKLDRKALRQMALSETD